MSTFKAVLLKGNIHLKDDGTSNIKIRVTHNRKADYISTDLFIILETLLCGVILNQLPTM